MALDIILNNVWPLTNTPFVFEAIFSFNALPALDGSTGNQQLSKQCSLIIALKCSSSFTNVHLSGVYPLFMRIHFHFLQILLSELRIFRRIHSCRDQQHMFQMKLSFTFQFLSTDYFTSYSFVCSQDAQSLRICEDGHQIQQTPGSLSCDYITASRAGQMALFRMSIDIISSIGTDDIKLWLCKTLFISWNTEHAL